MDFAKFTLIYLYADINNEYDKFQDVMTGNTADRPMYDNSIGKITSYYHEPAGNYQTMKLSGKTGASSYHMLCYAIITLISFSYLAS